MVVVEDAAPEACELGSFESPLFPSPPTLFTHSFRVIGAHDQEALGSTVRFFTLEIDAPLMTDWQAQGFHLIFGRPPPAFSFSRMAELHPNEFEQLLNACPLAAPDDVFTDFGEVTSELPAGGGARALGGMYFGVSADQLCRLSDDREYVGCRRRDEAFDEMFLWDGDPP